MLKQTLIVTALLLMGLLITPAFAASDVTYEQLKSQLAVHPDYLALVSQSAAFKYAADGEQGLPDPEVRIGVDNYPLNGGGFDEFLPTSKTLSFTQKIPNWNVLDAKTKEKLMRSGQSSIQADWMLKQLEARLIITLAEFDSILQQITLLESQQELLKLEAVYWDGRLQGGESVYDERSGVDARLAALTVRKADLAAQKASHVAALKELTQMEVTEAVPLPAITQMPWTGETINLYPVMMAERAVQASEAQVDRREAAFGPNFSVGMIYKQRQRGRNFAGDDWITAGVGITVPLWYSTNQQPKLRAAQSNRSKVKSNLNMVMRVWRSRLTSLNSSIQETGKAVQALEEQYAALKEKTASLTSAYESGSMDLDAVIFSEFTQTDIEARLVRTKAAQIKLIAEHNSVFGGQKDEK